MLFSGLPRWFSSKESACQCRICKRCRFDPWVRKISWSRKWQPTPVCSPGKFHGQRSLAGYIVHGATKSQTQLTQDIHSLFSRLISELFLLFSHSVGFDSLRPHRLQHTRLSCPSLSLEVFSNSCPLSQCCHSTVLSSVTSFLCLQSFPASGSFPMSQLFTSGSQSIGASALASVFPMNIQG